MNILFLMKVYEIGGQEVVTSTLANYFIQHHHNVTIVSFKQPNEIMVARTNAQVHFYVLGKFKYSKEHVSLLHKILLKENIDVVINQWGLPYIPIMNLNEARKGTNIKIISIYHNTPESNARIKEVEISLSQTHNPLKKIILKCKKAIVKQITRLSMRYVYNHSDLYMLLSPSFIDKFKSFTGISKTEKLCIQTNPITISSCNFQYSQTKKQKEIIYVGRIDYNQKRVYRIIDTWKELENKYSDWKLTIIGDGPERKNLEQQVKKLKLKHVSFKGFQPPKAYYERASILLLTSEYEGFPLVLAECMSFGVIPVVYGSYSAVYDIIKQNINGIIIEPKNKKFCKIDMAKQLSYIMSNDTRREKIAQMAIKTSKNYSIDTIYQSWERILNDLK